MVEAKSVAADRFPVERATARGLSQAFAQAGEGGFPLLLVHGWPETRRLWWRNLASFADGTKFRASLGTTESARSEMARVARRLFGENPTRALILSGIGDLVVPPDFDRMTEPVFPDRGGPFRVVGAGHFLQWEAAELPNGAIRGFCGDFLEGGTDTRAREEVFVALGSNLGEREVHLAGAVSALRRLRGADLLEVSPVYETDPVGPPGQGPYLNAVARLRVSLAPRVLLHRLLEIEAAAGRVRSEPNAPRTLDLDLLFYGEREIDEPGLRVPHPRLHERAFVLEPLRDIAPGWVHPTLHRRVEDLAERVREPRLVRRLE